MSEEAPPEPAPTPTEAELGVVERRVRVHNASGKARALVQTDRGVWLLDDATAEGDAPIDVLAMSPLRYQTGQLRDEIVAGELLLTVSFARRGAARLALALGRLRPRQRSSLGRGEPFCRFVDPIDDVARAFLEAHLDPDEHLLAWLPTTTQETLEESILTGPAPRWFMMTDRRTEVVTLSALGDHRAVAVPQQRLTVDRGKLGGARVLTTELEFAAAPASAGRFAELAGAVGLEGCDRLLEVGRRAVDGGRDEDRSAARRWLDACLDQSDGMAVAVAVMIDATEAAPPAPNQGEFDVGLVLKTLKEREAAAETLADLWRDFQLGDAAGRALLQAIRHHKRQAEPWALALHRALHAETAATKKLSSVAAARNDVHLARHLLGLGHKEEARDLLEARLRHLPNEKRRELLPPTDADLTEGEGGQATRIQVYETLARARTDGDGSDPGAVAELARRQPLVSARIKALKSVANDDLRRRADAVLAVLERGGLGRSETSAFSSVVGLLSGNGPAPEPRPLTDSLISEVLRHPGAKDERKILERIQSSLAKVPQPDHQVLRDYCERLSSERSGAAVRALAAARRLLDLDEVPGFVSRGDKGVGFRAYDGKAPFVLIGGQHLDPSSSHHMSEAELRFALGSELAHLRYRHVRVTPGEVWDGTVSTAKSGLELALGFIPALGRTGLADEVASRVLVPAMSFAWRASERRRQQRDGQRLRPAATAGDGLSPLDEQLLVTHRVMQLTADRAGLVLAGDLRAALRAMLLVRRDFHDELPVVEKHGIARVLGQRSDDGHMAYQTLAVRVAALLRFYLAPEFARLVAAAYP